MKVTITREYPDDFFGSDSDSEIIEFVLEDLGDFTDGCIWNIERKR